MIKGILYITYKHIKKEIILNKGIYIIGLYNNNNNMKIHIKYTIK